MSLKESYWGKAMRPELFIVQAFLQELEPYIQGCGLVDASRLPEPTPFERGDNSTMFFGEAICIVSLMLGAPEPDVARMVRETLDPCFIEPGLLKRSPSNHNIDGPDNMLGVLAACRLSGETSIPRAILRYGMRHGGWFNQPNPGSIRNAQGHIQWEAFLWRQVQLIVAAVEASRFPFFILWPLRLILTPLYMWTAGVLLAAAYAKSPPPPEGMDAYRLTWLLRQCVEGNLFLRLAGYLWFIRLHRDFPMGMMDVASHYYEEGHPFSKWWCSSKPKITMRTISHEE